MSSLLKAVALRAAKSRASSTTLMTGMTRILDLPAEHFTGQQKDDYAQFWSKELRSHPESRSLRRIQGEILQVASQQALKPWAAGMLGLVGVGAGKTLPFFLMPQVFGAERPLLLVPADMISGGQLLKDHFEWSQEYDMLPIHVIKRGIVPDVRTRTLFIMSYAQLSQPSGTDVLRRLAPDLIMADEAHALGDPTSSRTMRFIRHMKAAPDTRFVAMSGTLTGSSLTDYAHLAEIALRHESFLPEEDADLKSWCGVLDAKATGSDIDHIKFDALVTWAREEAGKGMTSGLAGEEEVRWAYNYRMTTMPGVVATTSPSCDSDLILQGWSDIAFTADTDLTVPEAMKRLMKHDTLPNGMLVEDSLSKAAAMHQLSMGFYYYWKWPDDEPDEDYVLAKRTWDKAVRQYLKNYAREGVDSPWLVDQYVRECLLARKKVSDDLVYAQAAWDEQKHKPQPPTAAEWLDFSVILSAVEWSRKHEGFIWFSSTAVGQALQAFGIPTFWEGMPDPQKHRRAALSLKVFNKGKNLQPWDNQLYMQIPSDAKIWEQSLGRTHRAGQKSTIVRATVMQHTWVLRNSWRTSLARANYIQGTTGQLQRLCFSQRRGLSDHNSFDPKPYEKEKKGKKR